jgi:hypothetical protein
VLVHSAPEELAIFDETVEEYFWDRERASCVKDLGQ